MPPIPEFTSPSPPAPGPPALAPDEVHVWAVSPDASPEEAEILLACLSAHERHRAFRMHAPDHRQAFVVGRARVRQILSRYVGRHAADLDIVARVDDKPTLEGAPPWFDFSFSRCAGLHVCVVAARRRIGVDIEAVGDRGQARPMAMADCSARDRAWLAGQPGPRRQEAFTELWTKKEAFVKGIGMSVETSLALVEVPHGQDGWVGPVSAQPGPRPWLVRTFTPQPGVIGAVAAEGQWRLTLLRYPAP